MMLMGRRMAKLTMLVGPSLRLAEPSGLKAKMRWAGPLTRSIRCHSVEKPLVVFRVGRGRETPGLSELSLQRVKLRSTWSEMAPKSTQMLAEEVKTMWRWVLEVRTRWRLVVGRQQTRPLCGTFESWRALLLSSQEVRPCHPCLSPRSTLRHIRQRAFGWLLETHVLDRSKLLDNAGLVILVLSGEQVHFGGKLGRMMGMGRAALWGRPW